MRWDPYSLASDTEFDVFWKRHLAQRERRLLLVVGKGFDVRALEAARGHPGLAAAWLRDGGLALRREVAGDLAQLEGGRAAPIAMAQRWVADGQGGARLRHAADLALQAARDGLTDPRRARSLAGWFDAVNRTRDLLRTQVRADLAVAEVLLGWREASAPAATRSRR